jgi:hypothetical protein
MYAELWLGLVTGVCVSFAMFMICFLAGMFHNLKVDTQTKPISPLSFSKKQSPQKRKPKVHDDYNAWVAEQKEERELP